MLILSRRDGDSILIGDNIRVVVLECDRRGVRLGIEAPAEVRILRAEIANRTPPLATTEPSPDVAREWIASLRFRNLDQSSDKKKTNDAA